MSKIERKFQAEKKKRKKQEKEENMRKRAKLRAQDLQKLNSNL